MRDATLSGLLRAIPGALHRELRAITIHGPKAHEAIKAVLSVYLAVSVAALLQLDDLVWAAISGFMVMRGDVKITVPRGLNRIVGTVAGAAIGLALAPAATENPVVMMISLFAVSWVGIFGALRSRQSYAWMFVGLTAGLILTEAMSAPNMIWRYALTRFLEIVVGTSACLLVACLLDRNKAVTPPASQPHETRSCWHLARCRDFQEEWLRAHWPLLVHATRAALAVAVLPLVWRWFGIQHFSQTAVTSYVLMIIPASLARNGHPHPVYERLAHRVTGCLLGGSMAILCAGVPAESVLFPMVAVGAAIWIGSQIQNGKEGVNYVGTQFTMGFLITFIQGPGPPVSMMPGLERLLGIVIGGALLCFMFLAWPATRDE